VRPEKKELGVPLDAVVLKVMIEATFEIDNNGLDIDDSIERGLDELKGYGEARIVSRQLFGKVSK
jgi:hypothetical protein